MSQSRKLIDKWVKRFIHLESLSSIFLGMSTLLAMAIANSSWAEEYFAFINFKILNLSLQQWINDALMVIFFFVVALEIKREVISGSLSSLKKSAFPVAAAIGGMLAPAFIYCVINKDAGSLKGWAIPTATDIAFALGVLSLLGKRVPLSLKTFLLTLAIADDMGAIFIIAVFYTNEIRWVGMAIAFAAVFALVMARRSKIEFYYVYLLIGVTVWLGVFYSGIHPTIAGVIMGLMTPNKIYSSIDPKIIYSPIDNLIQKLQPWVSFGIMPIFAFANAGISIGDLSPTVLIHNSVAVGIFLGLFLGKPLGILLTSLLTVSLGLAVKPNDLKWKNLVGVSFLAGIGFTMAMFITNLSLIQKNEVEAKLTILIGSFAAALIGYFILRLSLLKNGREV